MKCPYCGQEHLDDFKFCPATGKELEQQFWICDKPDCDYRQPLPLTAKFCPNCGGSQVGSNEREYKKQNQSESDRKISPRIVAITNGYDCEISSYGVSIGLKEGKNNIRLSTHPFLEEHFYITGDASQLTAIDFVGYDTANVTDMSAMFYGCESLVSLDLSGFDTANVTDMSGMFRGCESLVSLDLSGFDTANVTDMSGMFRGCKSLVSLDLNGFDTANVTDMSAMFYGCESLVSIDLSAIDIASVTHMSGMFKGCVSLESLDLSGFDTANVTCMNVMFYRCKSLKTVILKGCNDATIDKIEECLEESELLDSVEIITD